MVLMLPSFVMYVTTIGGGCMNQEMILIVPRQDIADLTSLLGSPQGIQFGAPVSSASYSARRVFLPRRYHPDRFVDTVHRHSPTAAVYGGVIPQEDIQRYDGLRPALEAWNLDRIAEERMLDESPAYR